MLKLWDGASACLETHCLSDRHDLSVSTSRPSVKGATSLGLFRMVAMQTCNPLPNCQGPPSIGQVALRNLPAQSAGPTSQTVYKKIPHDTPRIPLSICFITVND